MKKTIKSGVFKAEYSDLYDMYNISLHRYIVVTKSTIGNKLLFSNEEEIELNDLINKCKQELNKI